MKQNCRYRKSRWTDPLKSTYVLLVPYDHEDGRQLGHREEVLEPGGQLHRKAVHEGDESEAAGGCTTVTMSQL